MKSEIILLVMMFLMTFFLIGCQNNYQEVSDDKNVYDFEEKNTGNSKDFDLKEEEKKYSEDIGKTFCNATNDKCVGEIVEVRTCTRVASQKCYIVDMGEGYSRPSEHPVSNGYAK